MGGSGARQCGGGGEEKVCERRKTGKGASQGLLTGACG
jgi:hypothetical protein